MAGHRTSAGWGTGAAYGELFQVAEPGSGVGQSARRSGQPCAGPAVGPRTLASAWALEMSVVQGDIAPAREIG
jgi:hypothetical protein